MESDRLTCKNAVEEYVYDIRSKIHGDLSDFITEDVRGKYSNELEDSENWLYEEGEDVEKKVYVEKLKSLQVLGEAVKQRKQEYDGRENAFNSFGHSLNMATKVIEAFKAGDEKYAHLDGEAVQKVSNMIGEKKEWLNASIHTLSNLDKTSDPSILLSAFFDEKKSFEAFATPILNKAKPKVEPPKEPEPENPPSQQPPPTSEEPPKAPNNSNAGEDPAQGMAVD
ncbi:HSP70 family member 1 [Caligus rogercresseyi]|uniref:HSP70 family member 1 n=1 Tax=Caligus rogercresseyi TaxID=217165 RepID=A0A7T8JWZ0_CALRO|nr:HSP70 family member 1 [Caligus rogercresseyi]